jgi:hypothetical protein
MESKLCEEQFKNFGEEIEKYEKLYQQMKDWKSGIESEMEKKDAEIARLIGLAKQFEEESAKNIQPEQQEDEFIMGDIYGQSDTENQDNPMNQRDEYRMEDIYGDGNQLGVDNPMLTPDENRSEKSDEEILYEQPLIGSEDIKRADGTKIIERVSNVDTYSALLSAVLNDINYRDDKHIQNLIKRMRKYKFSKNIDHDTDASHKQLSESFRRNMKNVGKNPNNYGVGRILNIDKPNPNPNLNPKPQQQQQQSRRLPATQMSRRRGGKSKKFKRTRKKY